MVNNIYLRLLNDVDVQLSPSNANNNISIRTPDNLIVDIIRPKRLVAIGESYEGLMFSLATYEDYGMLKVNPDTGLVITNGELSFDDGVLPVNTSDLTNDGDGTSPYATEDYVDTNGGKIDSISVNNVTQTIDANKNVNLTVPTKTSDLTNDSGFINNTVNTLVNYYLKSDTYTKSEIATLLSGIKTVSISIVQTLPTADDTTYFNNSKVIYFAPVVDGSSNDYYDEYICVRTGTEGSYTYSWEKIGNTRIDLSGYVQKTTKIAGVNLQDDITISELQVALQDYMHNFISTSLLYKLDGIQTGAEVNVQSDWAQTDTTADDYIKNKPNVPEDITNFVKNNIITEVPLGDDVLTFYSTISNEGLQRCMGVTLDETITIGDNANVGSWIATLPYIGVLIHAGIGNDFNDTEPKDTTDVSITGEGIVIAIKHIDSNNVETRKRFIFDREECGVEVPFVAESFSITDGTSSQFLKADGSVDSNTYATETYVQQNGGKIDTISVNGTQQTITNKNVDITVPTQTSQLTNNSGFITNTVNNLTNYYLKSETYTQTEVNALIGAIKTIKVEIVQTLPTASSTTYFNESKTMYMVRNSATSGSDYYNEYITVRTGSEGSYVYSWENIGSTQVDLSNYYTKTQTDTLLTNKMDKSNPTGTGSLSLNRSANTTTGTNSVAIGNNCEASGNYSCAEGLSTTASNTASHAEGNSTTATGKNAHAEGNTTSASGDYSHAEGRYSAASGKNAHAEGSNGLAYGDYSHAQGQGTIAQRKAQHAMGQYNIADTTGADVTVRGEFIEIVGNGTDNNNRSNARTLDWDGNEKLAGWLTMNGSVKAVGRSGSASQTTEQTLLDNYYTKSQTDAKLEKTIIQKRFDYDHVVTAGTSEVNLVFGDGTSSVSFYSHGGKCKITGGAFMYQSNGGNHYVELWIDGVAYNIIMTSPTSYNSFHGFDFLTDELSVGSHTIVLKLFTNTGTCTVSESSISRIIFEEV